MSWRRLAISCILVLSSVAWLGCDSAKPPLEPPGENPPPVDPIPAGATHPSGDAISFLPLDGRPHGVATSRDGVFYISLIDNSSAVRGRIMEPGQVFEGMASTGIAPAHVALNAAATRAYTTNQFGNSVSVIDVTSNQTMATVGLSGGGFNLLVSPTGARVFATTGTGILHVIDATSNTVISQLGVGAAANGLAYHAGSATLYVSSRDGALVTAIDAENLSVVRTYPVSGMPQRIAVARDASELYIASETVGLEILDLETGARSTVSGVASGAVGLALSPDAAQLYVTNPPAGTVTVVDRETRAIVRMLTGMGRPRNVAFGSLGRVAIITDEYNRVAFVR